QRRDARALNPSGIVNAGDRRMLRPELWLRLPPAVEEHQENPHVVPRADGEELIDAAPEARRVLPPEQVVQKHTHGVHADGFGPAELAVDPLRIEGLRLPPL